MKKLYFLDESEKERILKLHESHTKKQYLMQEQQMMADIRSGMAAGALAGGALGATGFGVGAIPGALIGGSIGLISALFNTTTRPEFKKQITKVCESGKLGNPIDDAKLDTIAAELKKLIETTNIMGAGRATSASQESIKKQLSQIASVPDFCQIINRYKENYNKDLLDQLSGEFYLDDAWNTYVRLPLMTAVRKTQQLTKNAGTSTSNANVPENWKSYPCVTKSTNVVATRLKNGSLGYKGGGFLWYSNGRKQNLQNGEMSNYHCGEDGKVKEGLKSEVSNKQFANVEPVSGIGVVIPSAQTEIPTLMKMAGMEGQPINQDTINKLYDILLKK